MSETEAKPLEEVLFGPAISAVGKPETDLAETISLLFRVARLKVRESAVRGREREVVAGRRRMRQPKEGEWEEV